MIKMRNSQELIFNLHIPSTITPSATVKAVLVVPFTGFIKAIYAVLGTADGTSGQADIQKNGTSMASSGNLLVFGTTVNGVLTLPTTNPLTVTKGDILTLTFPTATGGQAANLSVLIVFSRRPVATTEYGTISADSDLVD
jgi:hypothetical protein